MKKLFTCFLLIFALLISACASGENQGTEENSDLPELGFPAPAEADFTSNNEAAAPEPESGYEDTYIAGSGGDIVYSEPPASPAETPAVARESERETALTADMAAARSVTDDESPSGGGVLSTVSPILAAETDVMFSGDMPSAEFFGDISGEYSIAAQSQSVSIQVQAGLMTAGEWNDNNNWDFWVNLMGQNHEFRGFTTHWQLHPTRRYIVKVTDENGNPIRGAEVSITGFKAITNHEGIAYVFRALNPLLEFNSPTTFTVTANGETQTAHAAAENVFIFKGAKSPAELKLDLMFVIDTTGSMGDELHYLQAEIDYVINSVSSNNANLPIRLSVNFYRDIGDEYVVRPFTFSTDIAAQVRNLNAQNAAGGGDRPEAVDAALQNAIHEHTWLDDSVKLMFIVLDAPPHHNQTTVPAMSRLALEAAEKGIRIIPLLASDGCTETEFLMRTLAMTTGGTYTFVTGHSGISTGRHVEPTIGDYDVEKLNELLIKIINRYLQ
ncbi:MAG: VWA domain-containing protein [Oscillospiraceae bacterium]|jgi:hypothetical protein|nr:VWA domain-containing protein [Oscillospiraceae bacterium]